MYRSVFLLAFFCCSLSVIADEPSKKPTTPATAKKQPTQKQSAKPRSVDQPKSPSTIKESKEDEKSIRDQPKVPAFEISKEVREVLSPLFSSIVKAKVSRATVEMLADSLLSGNVVESQRSTYQIASSVDPDKFTIYLKEPQQRTRIYCDSKSIAIALAPDAYFRLPEPIGTQQAATQLPVPMGPYPEPVLSLSLAGVDPAISFVAGMKSVEIIDRKKFRGDVPAVHVRGVQADNVTWDFWMTDHKEPKPLRFLVDMTPMLIASKQVAVPKGFSYQVRYDFLTWRISGEVDDRLFEYAPSEDAEEYKSLQDYYETLSGVSAEHPLLGKPAPSFKTDSLSGEAFDSKSLRGKVVVIDFWATWCGPCLAAMPVIQSVTDKYADKDVVFVALNTGETKEKIEAFLKENKLDVSVLLDPEGEIANAFAADAIPQTIVIGKTGAIESVHVGFPGEDEMKQRLKDELDVLSVGGLIGSIRTESTTKAEAKIEISEEKSAKPITKKSRKKKTPGPSPAKKTAL